MRWEVGGMRVGGRYEGGCEGVRVCGLEVGGMRVGVKV